MEVNENGYSEMREWLEYQRQSNRPAFTRSQFEDALVAKYWVNGHPKLDLALRLAWEHGHSSGYHEVLLDFDELVEFLK